MIAVIPAAGLGTRLLPLTKSVPKELLPVGNRPALQWVLEEIYEAGIDEIVVVTSRSKPGIRHFLSRSSLRKQYSDIKSLMRLEDLLDVLRITFVEQLEPLGLRDAIWRCRSIVGDQPFALVMPDNLSTKHLLKDLLAAQVASEKSCLAIYSFAESRRHLQTASFVITLDSVEGKKKSIARIAPKVANQYLDNSMRLGIGRSVFSKGIIDMFNPQNYLGSEIETNEVPVLNELTKRGELLAVENENEIWHIGSMDEYLAAFRCLVESRAK